MQSNNGPPFETSWTTSQNVSVDYGGSEPFESSKSLNTGETNIPTSTSHNNLLENQSGRAIQAYTIDSDDESDTSEVSALQIAVLPTSTEIAQKARLKLRRYMFISIVLLMVISAAIMIPIYFFVLKPKPTDISERPSMIPSIAPSFSPTQILYAEYIDKISQISNATLINIPGTPQYQAMRWLYHHDPAGRRDINDPRLFQRYIAAVFYYSTSNGRGWYDCFKSDSACTTGSKKSWLSSWDECEWYGFEKCNEDGFLTKFIILKNQNGVGNTPHGNGLDGTLPDEFGYLTSLEELQIDRNPLLVSNIPSSFRNLKRLRKLSLAFNNLQEPWHEGLLDDMNDLVGLYLGWNDFNMTLPLDISRRTTLMSIDMGGNHLYGKIPQEYGQLSSLTILDLDNNDLTGELPLQLFPSDGNTGLSSLKRLDLKKNKLNGTLSFFGNLLTLEELYLSNNDFSGAIPRSFENIGSSSANPKVIALDGNSLSGIIPAELGSINNLVSLNLTSNAFDEQELPEEICDLNPSISELREIFVDCHVISCSCCDSICNNII